MGSPSRIGIWALLLGTGWFCQSCVPARSATPPPPRSEPFLRWQAQLGPTRPSRARLVGFPFAEKESPGQVRLSRELLAAEDEILRRVEDGPEDPQALWEAGLVHLVVGRIDKAVEMLQIAARMTPQVAAPWNDLAAAYYEKATREESPYFFTKALEAVLEALDRDARLDEAIFNRALLLDTFFLRNQARTAWKQAAAATREHGYRKEIGGHLKRLREPTLARRWKTVDPVSETIDLKSEGELTQQVREWCLKSGFPRWSDLRQKDPQEGREILRRLRGYGTWLSEGAQDDSVLEIVGAIEKRGVSADSQNTQAYARAFAHYGGGEAAFYGGDYEVAETKLTAARRLSEPGLPSLVGWCDVLLALIETYAGSVHESSAIAEAALSAVDNRRYAALAGRLEWVLGLNRLRQRELMDAKAHFDRAAAHFQRSREWKNGGSIEVLRGSVYRNLGLVPQGWQHLFEGLRRLSQFDDSYWLSNALIEAVAHLNIEQQPALALEFRDENIAAVLGLARIYSAPDFISAADAFQARAQTLSALGRLEDAEADLRRAESFAKRIPDMTSRLRARTDNQLAEANLFAEINPARAEAAWRGCLNAYVCLSVGAKFMDTLQTGVRIFENLGRPDQAGFLLEGVIAELARQNRRVGRRRLRLDHFGRLKPAYDLLVQKSVERGDLLTSLGYLEEMSALLFTQDLPGDSQEIVSETLDLLVKRTPADTLVIRYGIVADKTLAWLVASGVSRTEVFETGDDLSRTLEQVIEPGGLEIRRPEVRAALHRLYDLLILPFEGLLEHKKKLIVVPDENLRALPFSALLDPRGKHLVEGLTVVKAVNLSSLAHQQSEAPGRVERVLLASGGAPPPSFAFLGSTPGAQAEIDEIGKLYGARASVLPAQSDPGELLRLLDRTSVFHFAGHAIAGRSMGLLLGDRGLVTDSELYSRSFPHLELAILSACDTGESVSAFRPGVFGLAHPLLSGGAAAVIATLWRVDDSEAKQLMVDFHRAYRNNRNAASSLRAAQRAAIEQGTESGSGDWAAFDLIVSRLGPARDETGRR